MTKENLAFVLDGLEKLYPETKTFLHYQTDWQLLFAIILSAQATDVSVNKATEVLFVKYPSLEDYTEENKSGILSCIRQVGLSNSKANYLVKTAKVLVEQYDGKVPTDRDALQVLPGVGYKTSGVFLAEFYNMPYIPVDTHVFRVSHRLGMVPDSLTPEKTEVALEKKCSKVKSPIALHRQLILFGREICHAKNPECEKCPFYAQCRFIKSKK